MPGLLDDFDLSSPAAQGLLAAAFGGLAGARRGAPLNSIGRAGLSGLSGYAGAQDRQFAQQDQATQRQMTQLALEKATRDNANEKGLLGLQPEYFTPGSAGNPGTAGLNEMMPPEMRTGAVMPATPATAPKFDVTGYTSAALSKGLMTPIQAAQMQATFAKENAVDKLKPSDYTPASLARYQQTRNYADLVPRDKLEFVEGVGVNPYDPKNANRSIPNPNKPFQMGPDGQPVPNTAYQQYEIGKAKAGASNTSIKVENKMGEGLASQVGPMMKDSVSATEGAAKQIDAANRIIAAVDSNKVIAGTGAEARLTAAQVADTLGIGGEDNKTRIANTRQALQGLSQLTLQGRAQMKGQGAITESESKLAERATSGDISMTPAEIKQLANAARRAANYVQSEHQRKLKVIQGNPSLAGMAPFYDVTPVAPMAEVPSAPATPTPSYRYENGKLVKVQ